MDAEQEQRWIDLFRSRAKLELASLVVMPHAEKRDSVTKEVAEHNYEHLIGVFDMLETHIFPEYRELVQLIGRADSSQGIISKYQPDTSTRMRMLWATGEARKLTRLLAYLVMRYKRWPQGGGRCCLS